MRKAKSITQEYIAIVLEFQLTNFNSNGEGGPIIYDAGEIIAFIEDNKILRMKDMSIVHIPENSIFYQMLTDEDVQKFKVTLRKKKGDKYGK